MPFSIIHAWQSVRAFLTSDSATIYKGKLMLLSRTLDSNRSSTVHCHFRFAEPNLLPGMFINGEIEISSSLVISVWEKPPCISDNKGYVFVDRGNKTFELIPVTAPIAENGYTTVTSMSMH